MPITAKVPFEVEEVAPKPAKTLTDTWLRRIVLDMPSPTQGVAHITEYYFDPSTGEVINEDAGHTFIQDLPLAIASLPKTAAVYAAIVDAFAELRDWQALQDALEPELEPEPEPVPELEPEPEPEPASALTEEAV